MTGDAQPPEGRWEGAEHLFPLRVYFEDTDLSGVVYHANYLRWMERARSDMLRLAGIDQRGVWEAGEGAYAVADLHIRYRAPARLDDALTVVSRVTHTTPARVRIHQTVRRGGQTLAEADVVAALVGSGGRPRRQPRAWTDIYAGLVAQANQGAE